MRMDPAVLTASRNNPAFVKKAYCKFESTEEEQSGLSEHKFK
jgi:hypothetical protein